MQDYRLRFVVLSNMIGLFAVFKTSISLRTNEYETTYSNDSVKLLYGDSAGITWSDLEVSKRLAPLLTVERMDVIALDYHYNHGLVFFSASGDIYRANVTSETPIRLEERVIIAEDAGARSLAVDWVQDHIYWATNRSLHRAQLDGSDAQTVLQRTSESDAIRSIALDPYARLLFVAEAGGAWSLDLRSESARCLRLVGAERVRVVGLALSARARRLFLSARAVGAPRLYSCDYDGSNVVEYRIDSEWWGDLVAIAVFSDYLFWIHRGWSERDTVWKAIVSKNVSISWDMEFLARGSNVEEEISINALAAYHPDVQTGARYDDENRYQDNTYVDEPTVIKFDEGRCHEFIFVASDGSRSWYCTTYFVFIYVSLVFVHTFTIKNTL